MQIKWEKINNKIDDKHLIEKSIDINANDKQLYISYKQYKFQVLLKIFFKNYLPKNFHKLPFEKQQFIIYMNIVLNYERTELLIGKSYWSAVGIPININMFKDEAIKYKIING
ncbi:MAG0920 family protein [Mycoplasmopsis lipophila]|uniref:MAG0920 family protein n=1 Tax=Mycoplasmopsis lipophila TaxID=2117 RepID=UPI0038732681